MHLHVGGCFFQACSQTQFWRPNLGGRSCAASGCRREQSGKLPAVALAKIAPGGLEAVHRAAKFCPGVYEACRGEMCAKAFARQFTGGPVPAEGRRCWAAIGNRFNVETRCDRPRQRHDDQWARALAIPGHKEIPSGKGLFPPPPAIATPALSPTRGARWVKALRAAEELAQPPLNEGTRFEAASRCRGHRPWLVMFSPNSNPSGMASNNPRPHLAQQEPPRGRAPTSSRVGRTSCCGSSSSGRSREQAVYCSVMR